MRAALIRSLMVLLLLLGSAASAVTMDYVSVGNPGNACDTQVTGCYGAVDYAYDVGKYEVTNSQYVEFLNAKAATDSLGLYNTLMATSPGGITRAGVSGSFTYSVVTGRGDIPVNYVSIYDAMRFTNWLANGQGGASTETGSYTLLGGTATPSNPGVARNAGPSIFLASENEWYKAAYYDAVSTNYFDFPAGSDLQTVCSAASGLANHANCQNQAAVNLTIKGSYTASASPAGAFDMGGNVREWTEETVGLNRILRGGSYSQLAATLGADSRMQFPAAGENVNTGFRVVNVIPEPGTGLLLLGGLIGLARRRRSQKRES